MIQIKIILVRPQHSGNVGAVARAMYVCGLKELHVVGSQDILDDNAYTRAVKATDILDQATIHHSLSNALQGDSWTIVCSARQRHLNFNTLLPEELVFLPYKLPKNSTVSIVFGPERTGLTGEEILMGNQLLSIPMEDLNTSYNLSHAVQLIGYFISRMPKDIPSLQSEPLIPHQQKQEWYQFINKTLIDSDFVMSSNPQHSLMLIKSIFNRLMLTENELNLLSGVFAKMKKNGRIQR
ncbi:MAG TPA: TrmJ/YjtD family RNA methyltransferase [Gammaproteobacteria bacterium]|nr:TrmJ/YjtD family RNA methyltransferase [Gammaproteobacteria bacterium]